MSGFAAQALARSRGLALPSYLSDGVVRGLANLAAGADFYPTALAGLEFGDGRYRQGVIYSETIADLPGYSHSVAPTITPATGYLHESGDNLHLTGLPNPAGDFTLVVDALGPASGAVYRLAAVLDGGGANPGDRIEFYRNNAGDIARIIVYNAGATVVDTNLGTGTDVSNPVWAAGVAMRLGIVRTGGILRPYIGGALQSGSVAYAKSLTALRVGHGWQGGAQVAPFESTIERVLLLPTALSGAEIGAL